MKYAESILIANQQESSSNGELLAMTCGNLGCLYKAAGKLLWIPIQLDLRRVRVRLLNPIG